MSPLEHLSQSDALFLRISGCSPATVHRVDFYFVPHHSIYFMLDTIAKMQLKRVSAKASACCFQICLCCTLFCQTVPLQYSSSSCLHHLAGLTLDGFPRGDTRCPSRISYYIDVPCPGSLQASILFNHVYDFCVIFYPCLFFCPSMSCLTQLFPSFFEPVCPLSGW